MLAAFLLFLVVLGCVLPLHNFNFRLRYKTFEFQFDLRPPGAPGFESYSLPSGYGSESDDPSETLVARYRRRPAVAGYDYDFDSRGNHSSVTDSSA
jgi:hypothetical protein